MADCYPERLAERYKISELKESPEELLEEIGRKRGCLVSGGVVDLARAADLFLNELRGGKLGKISFEKPEGV